MNLLGKKLWENIYDLRSKENLTEDSREKMYKSDTFDCISNKNFKTINTFMISKLKVYNRPRKIVLSIWELRLIMHKNCYH